MRTFTEEELKTILNKAFYQARKNEKVFADNENVKNFYTGKKKQVYELVSTLGLKNEKEAEENLTIDEDVYERN